MKHLNIQIVEEVIKRMPGKKRPVTYLMKTLDLGKESAYRRIKNQIPFTFEEVIIIAKDLDLSIDQLLGQKTSNNITFSADFNLEQEPADIYVNILTKDIALIEKLITASDLKITAIINRIPLRFLPHKALFKFEYCHYLYSSGYIPLMAQFSDIIVPQQISDLHEKSSNYFRGLKNVNCILDSMVFPRLIKEIQYYHRMRFISDEDLHLLQTELFEMLEIYESLLRKGKNAAGSNYIFYYSLLNLDSNMVFIEFDNNFSLQLWIYPESSIIINNNPMINDIQKKLIDSKIRSSVMITKTNDTLQIEMLRDLYKQISDLTKSTNTI